MMNMTATTPVKVGVEFGEFDCAFPVFGVLPERPLDVSDIAPLLLRRFGDSIPGNGVRLLATCGSETRWCDW